MLIFVNKTHVSTLHYMYRFSPPVPHLKNNNIETYMPSAVILVACARVLQVLLFKSPTVPYTVASNMKIWPKYLTAWMFLADFSSCFFREVHNTTGSTTRTVKIIETPINVADRVALKSQGTSEIDSKNIKELVLVVCNGVSFLVWYFFVVFFSYWPTFVKNAGGCANSSHIQNTQRCDDG